MQSGVFWLADHQGRAAKIKNICVKCKVVWFESVFWVFSNCQSENRSLPVGQVLEKSRCVEKVGLTCSKSFAGDDDASNISSKINLSIAKR